MKTPRESLNRCLCCWTKAFLVNRRNSSCIFDILAKTGQFWISIFWGLILLSPRLYNEIIPRMATLVVGVESHWVQEPRFFSEHKPIPSQGTPDLASPLGRLTAWATERPPVATGLITGHLRFASLRLGALCSVPCFGIRQQTLAEINLSRTLYQC